MSHHCFDVPRGQVMLQCLRDGIVRRWWNGHRKTVRWSCFEPMLEVSINGCTPIAGCFFYWKILLKGMIWGYPHCREPPYIYCQAPGWLKTFGQFWCLGGGGGGARLVQTWCLAVFCASTSWCWKTPLLVSNFNFLVKSWCWESIFWGSECIFGGSETLMKLLEGFHEVAREAWRWWRQRCVCFYFPPLHQNWPNF